MPRNEVVEPEKMESPAPFSLESILESAEASVRRKADRRQELYNKRIDVQQRIFAWIGVLGFSDKLRLAKTEEEFRTVYRQMLFVHDNFSSPNAADDEQNKINESYGRTVLTLSDGLVLPIQRCERSIV